MGAIDPTKRKAIRDALLEHAASGRFPTYGQLGEPLEIHPRWPLWKLYLDDIAMEELAFNDPKRHPDFTWIIRSSRTKLPSQMDFKQIPKPTTADWQWAAQKAQLAIDRYCPGAVNPYL
ncbi:MAG: hypothetical protein E5Y73_11010 [Mesorhizobium sp.]|uniref:hypothetical protein n=1 Tax=Mesorhizobium sp. TaxID=1871066 RepID=UPI00121B62A7|nr:hypothetical protein [Mesorhizobium sp.]TIL94634.1 MAG: hypothetical protein E5Y73_11010 [Mesorhizobium sp.]